MIGKNIGQDKGGVRNRGTSYCPEDSTSLWEYWEDWREVSVLSHIFRFLEKMRGPSSDLKLWMLTNFFQQFIRNDGFFPLVSCFLYFPFFYHSGFLALQGHTVILLD